MGLDIYFRHTNIAFEGDQTNSDDFKKFTDEVDKQAQETLRKQLDTLMAPLRDAWEKMQTNDYWRNIYNERYFTFVEKLRPLIAKNYEFKIHPYTRQIVDLPELEGMIKEEIDNSYEEYDAYFRKVNFIFAYYENKGKMQNEWYALTDADDIDDLISRCEQVLKDHDLANALLPTQSGFFFGSTDYDEWYFSDVKDCLRQMKKYRKLLKDGVTGYVIFSW